MRGLGCGLLAAWALCLAPTGPVLAAETPNQQAAPVADVAEIRAQGEAAVAAARQADSAGAQQYLDQNSAFRTALKERLADSAGQISQATDEIATLQVQMVTTDHRITLEQGQLRILARAIYQQPESPLVVLTTSRSLGDAFTRVGDLLSTGRRAVDTKRSLEADLARATAQRARIQADLAQQRVLQAQLETDFQTLQQYAGKVEDTQNQVRAAAGQIPHADGPTQARMQEVIRQTWAPLGPAAVVWAQRIAFCESTYNPYSVNRSSAASGLFQFLPSTWAGTPYAAQSPFDPVANSTAAAWLYQRYGPSQWECSAPV